MDLENQARTPTALSLDGNVRFTNSEEPSTPTAQMKFHGAVFSLTNTIIGSGALTMPYVFAQCGWLLVHIIAFTIFAFTIYSVHLLVVTSDRIGGAQNFETLGQKTCGTAGWLYAVISFVVGGIGTLTGYLVFVGKLMAQVTGISLDQAYIPIVSASLLVILPLTLPRQINALRFISLLAVVPILYVAMMFLFFVTSVGKFENDNYKDVTIATWTSSSINSVNLLIGAFCVHNTCLPVYGEMQKRSPRNMVMATLCSMAISFVVYETIGLSGYVLLGGGVQGNCLLDLDKSFVEAYPRTAVPRNIAKVSMCLLITFSAPLALWPCRSAACSVITCARSRNIAQARGADKVGNAMFRSTGIFIVILVTVLAIWMPDVTVPLGVVNSLAGGSIIFVMPGMFYLGSFGRHWRSRCHLHAQCMVIVGLFVCILGFSLEVRSIIQKYG